MPPLDSTNTCRQGGALEQMITQYGLIDALGEHAQLQDIYTLYPNCCCKARPDVCDEDPGNK